MATKKNTQSFCPFFNSIYWYGVLFAAFPFLRRSSEQVKNQNFRQKITALKEQTFIEYKDVSGR